MKRFLALLLFFVAAMNVQTLSAQTNGDVNNDGSVNEADITAIIEIMKEANGVGPKKYYWYVGQENPASIDDITTLEGIQQVTSYPATYDYTVETRGYIYILLSNSKTLSRIIDTSNGFDINYSETTSSVSGYKLYKTAAVAAGCPLRFTIS